MIELGQDDHALAWARRGIEQTSGWQVAKLYDLAADRLDAAGEVGDVVELRRHHHTRTPTSSTYAALQAAARANGTWDAEISPARATLAERNHAGLIDALLADRRARTGMEHRHGGRRRAAVLTMAPPRRSS